jgi:hypothetical protein
MRFLEAIEADPLDRESRVGLALARGEARRAAIKHGCSLIDAGEFAAAAACSRKCSRTAAIPRRSPTFYENRGSAKR